MKTVILALLLLTSCGTPRPSCSDVESAYTIRANRECPPEAGAWDDCPEHEQLERELDAALAVCEVVE